MPIAVRGSRINRKDPVVILPVGSYEQHRPHLTLDTDSSIVLKLQRR